MGTDEANLLPRGITVLPDSAGWVQALYTLKGEPRRLFLRFEPTAEGVWHATGEMFVPHLTPQLLPRIPLNRIILAVNADADVKAKLQAELGDPPPDYLRSPLGHARQGQPLLIKRPKGRRLDDSFYKRVAVVYRQAIAQGLKPRQAIAEAARVSPDVAGRWIYEARNRELLPKTRPGKITA